MTVAATARTLVRARPRPDRRDLLAALLIVAVAASVAAVDWEGGILHHGGWPVFVDLLRSLANPDLTPAFLATAAAAAATTTAYAVAGISLAAAVGLPAAVVAAGVLARRRGIRAVSGGATRAVLAVLRAPDEIVWALLLVYVLGPSPLAGILAIAIPYGATIARVVAERLQDVPAQPLHALRSAGASETQVLLYGRLPMAATDVVAYVFYRFECALRAAAILSFVGLGGIGLQIDLALADLRFERVWTLLLILTAIIVAADAASGRVRRRLAP